MLRTSLITTQLTSVKDSFHVEKQATCYICIYLILIQTKMSEVYSFALVKVHSEFREASGQLQKWLAQRKLYL